MALVNACIFSNELDEGRMVTEGAKDKKIRRAALLGCLSMLKHRGKERLRKTVGGQD